MKILAISQLEKFGSHKINWVGSLTHGGGCLKEETVGLKMYYADFKAAGAFLLNSPLCIVGDDWYVGQSWVGFPETVSELIEKINSLPDSIFKATK